MGCNYEKKIPLVIQVTNEFSSFEGRNKSVISDKEALQFLLDRVVASSRFNVTISTSTSSEDDEFEGMALKSGVALVRGDLNDIPGRLCLAADKLNANDFVRIYANSPLVDIEQICVLYDEHVVGAYQYSYNEHNQGVLQGTGCDVFNVSFLKELNERDLNCFQRITISSYIQQNKSYRILRKEVYNPRPGYKVNLETLKDLEVINEVVQNVTMIDNEHIIEYMDKHPVLAKYNLESPSKEVGIEKLFLNPQKIESLLKDDYDMSYPISVEMTLTNACNLKCVYCSDQDLRLRQGCGMEMSIDTVEALFKDLSDGGTKGIVLEGGGEPTLYSGFDKVVECAKRNNLALGLITNGTVRLPEKILSCFEWIRVSLDASTDEEYLNLKGVDCFEKVVSNIAHYANYCNTVGVGYVVTKDNISQIETLVMRLRELGASYIQLRPVVDCQELYPEGVDLSYLKFYMNSKFGVIVDGMKENAEAGNAGLPCKTSSITSIISGDGSVYICGRLNIYDWLEPIGNINSQLFRSIWNGEERKKQLKMINDGDFCSHNCPQCRVSKFNQLLSRLNDTKSKHFI